MMLSIIAFSFFKPLLGSNGILAAMFFMLDTVGFYVSRWGFATHGRVSTYMSTTCGLQTRKYEKHYASAGGVR